MEKSGTIDRESAARLKHRLMESCFGLVENGMMTREVVDASSTPVENRKLLEHKRQLLLNAPKSVESENASESVD